MSVKISENEPYIITLDSLDSRYIRANINNNMSGVQPIWRNTRKEYYEFVVVADSDSDGESKEPRVTNGETEVSDEDTDIFDEESDGGTDPIHLIDYQMCHICNINVPAMFLGEHLKSEKHVLYRKLTKTALERVARDMCPSPPPNKVIVNQDFFYCDICSVAVSKVTRLQHNQSKLHLTSQKNDINMRAFIKIYGNEDSVIDNSKKHNDGVKKSVNEGSVTSTREGKLATSEITEVIIHGRKYVVIKTCASEKLLTVPRNHYYGCDDYGNCILCDLQRFDCIDRHIMSLEHLLKTEKPISRHCIREIDSVVNHCVVCNLRLSAEDTDEHITSNSHKINCHFNISYYTPEPQAKPLNKTYCKTCDRHIDAVNYTAHIKSKRHKAKAGVTIPITNTASIINNNSLYKINHITNGRNPKELTCELCKIRLPNTNQNVNEHIKAVRHKNNMMKSTNDVSVTNRLDDLYARVLNMSSNDGSDDTNEPSIVSEDYCEVCKVKLPQKGRTTHEMGRKHRRNLSKM